MKFTDFNLDAGLQEGLAEAGYITCMPVQEQVLQNALEGADLYVQSQTGTGKTAAYLVTILQRLATDPTLSGKKALVMVPTRELAVQVEEEARILGSCMKLKSASFYGGVGYGGQVDLLKKGVDVIIGTPGRVIDLQESRQMDLSQVAFLVIDEADRMFDMGFYPDLRTLIKVLPKAENRQTMLFSATLNATVKNLAWEYTVEAKEITIEAENVTVDEIDQMLFHVSSDQKMKLLLGLIQKEKPESLIVFCNTKRMSEVVAKRLKINGYEADFIIGDLPQSKRLQVIDSFKSGSLKMLVATDVAARGIDVDSLAMVINYDLPNEAENYVHRIGRTARAGKTGKAYSFCSEQDVYNLPAIEKYIENKVPSCVPGEEDYVEDKSKGVYIRTDRYDSDYDDEDGERGYRGRSSGGRGGHDSRGGRDSHGGSRGRAPGRPGEGRRTSDDHARTQVGPEFAGENARVADGSRRSGDGRRPEDGRRSESGRRFEDTRRHDGRRASPRDDTRSREERDLSKLSFEERMSYYKNKYGSEEAAKAAESQREALRGVAEEASQSETITKSGTRVRDTSRSRGDGDRRGGRDGQRGESRGDGRARQDNRPRGTPAPDSAKQGQGRAEGDRDGRRQQGRNAPQGGRGQGGRQGSRGERPAQGRDGQQRSAAASRPAQGAPAQKQAKPTAKGVGIGAFFRRLLKK
jgi:ATP-dependent RNA helicase RhlB